MSYGIFVKVSKDGKFLDFVTADKARANQARVNMNQINAHKKTVNVSTREAMDSSLKIAMLDLDYRSRNGFLIHKDWKYAAEKVKGIARISSI